MERIDKLILTGGNRIFQKHEFFDEMTIENQANSIAPRDIYHRKSSLKHCIIHAMISLFAVCRAGVLQLCWNIVKHIETY